MIFRKECAGERAKSVRGARGKCQMKKVSFDYFYGLQSEQHSFYRMPKLLFVGECFKGLSCEAKVLYGLLLDRMSLSVKNKWFDEQDRVYIIFTIEEVREFLSCSKGKAVKLMAELDTANGIGLIEKKRIGMGKANILYVKNFIVNDKTSKGSQKPINQQGSKDYKERTSRSSKNELQEVQKSDFKKSKNQTSSGTENELQEVQKLECNNTDSSNTDFNETNLIKSFDEVDGQLQKVQLQKEVVKGRIEYNCLIQEHGKRAVDELLELIVEILTTNKKYVKIAGDEIPSEVVKGRFNKIDYSHIEYVFFSLKENTTKVRNIKQYLLTVLYNAPSTIGHYYRAEVAHDMYGG